MKSFKNDKERTAFLRDYRNTENGWYKWKEDEDLTRQWWRYDYEYGSFIVEEQLQTYHYPNPHTEWSVIHWYIIKHENWLFADQVASFTQALQELKRWEKSSM